MEVLRSLYRDEDEEEVVNHSPAVSTAVVDSSEVMEIENLRPEMELTRTSKLVPPVEDLGQVQEVEAGPVTDDDFCGEDVKMFAEGENEFDSDDEEDEQPPKKQRQLSSLVMAPAETEAGEESNGARVTNGGIGKKSKKKYTCVWTKPARKTKKKSKTLDSFRLTAAPAVETALVTPMPKLLERSDDSPDLKICLSKVFKAEKVEVSEDRMSAGSVKGYRMVRATRGVVEGAWYFEIRVMHLGETGHVRLGWATEKGDLQAPVGYDAFSFGYRDIDGNKVHKGLRKEYGAEGFKEGDVLGFYINLPDGERYAPERSRVVLYKGQKYLSAPDEKQETSQVVPGSEISFFKNGICQEVAFKDICDGRYYPAASMYTLPNQPNCAVKFNFGPDFECLPSEYGNRPVPKAMVKVPYHGYDTQVDNSNVNPVSVNGNEKVNIS